MKVLSFRSVNFRYFLKIFILIAFLVCMLNVYITSDTSELLRKFREENMTIEALQNKLSGFMQRGGNGSRYFAADFIEDLDDGLTEQSKRIIKELGLVNPGEKNFFFLLSKFLFKKILKNS